VDIAALPRLQFQGFTLDRMRCCLWAGEREIGLRPKSFDVLCLLVERHGQLVTKDEIFQAVWPNVTVTDDSLFQCIKDVRQALNDTDQQFVKTVTGRGYVFTAPVTSLETSAAAASSASGDGTGAPRRRWTAIRWTAAAVILLMAVGAALIVLGGGVFPERQPRGLALPDRPSIAVLPFANLGGDPDHHHLSDGIAQDLSTSLSKFGELFVIAHSSAARYKGRDATSAEIGRELGVRYLLQGSVRKDAERVRIAAQLVEARTGAQIWGERYDRELAGAFTVQDAVVQQIAVRLVAQIGKSELDRTMRKAPEAWAAYDHYLRGNAFLQRSLADTGGATIAAAKEAFKRSLAADPRFAPAMRGLAATELTEWLNPYLFPTLNRTGSVRAWDDPERLVALDGIVHIAQQAIDLDPSQAEAYATLGFAVHWRHGPAA
jgi:TolB-like protein/DNA-binding winged helix-turn-helix (wHTH) protein